MSVTVTVCGCAGTHIGPDRACSSYLVAAGEHRLLLDCGNGSLMNLQRVCGVADLDAVVISHAHPDHFADLYSLFYALRFHADGPLSVPVHAPSGFPGWAAQILGDSSTEAFGEVLEFTVTRAGDVVRIGPMDVSFHRANHPVETLASRVEVDGRVLAYTADTGPTVDGLLDCALDADLLICDATWLERERPLPEGVHMTGAEAGQLAQQAGARRLLVTHVYPTTDPTEVAAEAAEHFDGEVLVARDLMELTL